MSTIQLAGLAVAAVLGVIAAVQAAMAARPAKPGIDGCARDALALASKLREIGCPEGVSACQTLLNVILEHPGHAKPHSPEVRT